MTPVNAEIAGHLIATENALIWVVAKISDKILRLLCVQEEVRRKPVVTKTILAVIQYFF